MERIWLKEYSPGVPAEADMKQFESIKHILETSCRRFGDLPAYSSMGATLTYADLDRLSAAFGAYLQRDLKLAPGDRVAIMMPNVLQYPIALFGVLRAGFTVVNVNPLYTARELQHQLADSGAKVIVVMENFARTLQDVLAQTPVKHVITTQIGDMLPGAKRLLVNLVVKHVKKMVPDWRIAGAVDFRQALSVGGGRSLDDVNVSHDDLAFLQYTGGTTGVAKGAMLTHGNMVANVQQCSAWMAPFLKEGEELMVTPLPLYHIFSLTVNCLLFMKAGGRNHLIANPRDIPNFIKDVKSLQFTAMTAVNTLYNALLNNPAITEVDTSRLKLCMGGGMAVQRPVAERWKKVLGVPIIEGYGLTETAPVACVNPLHVREFTGKIGLPVPSTEVSIRDDQGREVPRGEVGEICIRGPQVMKGYWNRPEETAKVMTPDGFFRTGDMGDMDEKGYVRITDRKKDMVLVSGFNVYPNEVEDVIAMHDKVLESAVIGIPDAHSGEQVIAVVVKKDPSLTAEELIKHCREHLTGYKVPKQVIFRDEALPKTNVGKVLRRLLRDEYVKTKAVA
ncbi:MAG TPA: long-chain-fatty-acid--CoA ligase [Pelomicrobium sp.]|nr:long-chain-fatty-acid--CoA ligase [Pelomicrobium sp.]